MPILQLCDRLAPIVGGLKVAVSAVWKKSVIIRNTLAIMAAASLTVAPIAAQANTRAADAGIAFSTVGSEDDDDDREGLFGGDDYLLILLVLLIGGGVAFAIEGDTSESNDTIPQPPTASPGTGG